MKNITIDSGVSKINSCEILHDYFFLISGMKIPLPVYSVAGQRGSATNEIRFNACDVYLSSMFLWFCIAVILLILCFPQ